MVGFLGKPHASTENLNDTYLQPSANKSYVLNPERICYISSSTPSLLGDSASSKTRKIYSCPQTFTCRFGYNCSHTSRCDEYMSDDPQAICPKCNVKLNREVNYVVAAASGSGAAGHKDEGGYVKGVVTYMIMDDLEVKPMSSISSITLLNRLNIKDLGALEEVDTCLRMDEGLKLLRASLQSKTVLSDVFLKKEA